MATFSESISVDVPIREAFVMFSDFERFPTFMEGVEEVRRIGDNTLHWKAEIGGREEEWEALIKEESVDERIAWTSTSGSKNDGLVTFEKLDESSTRINFHIEYEPEGIVENIGTMLGVVNGRIRGDLRRFKELAEDGGARVGGWHDAGQADQSAWTEARDDSSFRRDDYAGGQTGSSHRSDPTSARAHDTLDPQERVDSVMPRDAARPPANDYAYPDPEAGTEANWPGGHAGESQVPRGDRDGEVPGEVGTDPVRGVRDVERGVRDIERQVEEGVSETDRILERRSRDDY